VVGRVGFRWTSRGPGRRLSADVVLRDRGWCAQGDQGGFRGLASGVAEVYFAKRDNEIKGLSRYRPMGGVPRPRSFASVISHGVFTK